ncbi:MAG: hypothetical protein CMP22_04955 [Rickettsiales bacterium]|nr:hypothetical protein [Rickettsiales bacterium]|tara:strand:+ start:372 stop:1127 length:756 start_codon:yes stop_codon:yes gene_type:complete
MSGGGDDNDLSAIAWPGFVDILSSVVIMFVFFVLLVSVALYFHVITYKAKVQKDAVNLAMEAVSKVKTDDQKMLEKFYTDAPKATSKKTEDSKTESDLILDLKQRNIALEKTVESLEKKLFQSRSEFTESEFQEIKEDPENGKFIIFFGADSITLTTDTQEKLEAFIAKMGEKYDLKSAPGAIKAGVSRQSPTRAAARKLSVARMLNTRNSFIETGFNMKNLSIEIEPDRSIDGDYLWVEISIGEQAGEGE